MNGVLSRIVLPVVALALGALAAVTLLDRLGAGEKATARRALIAREAALTRAALSPGSALACLAGAGGETVQDACEARVFASPESTAAALAYMGARLDWLADAAAANDPGLRRRVSAVRRTVELDRFGLAAQVLAAREGCTPGACVAFAALTDTAALKANLKAHAFDQYVSRHAPAWRQPAAAPPAAVAATRAAPPPAAETVAAEPPASPPPAHRPVSSKYDFPSADSIPAVSIMTAEPPLPKPPQADDGKQTAPAPAAPVNAGPAH